MPASVIFGGFQPAEVAPWTQLSPPYYWSVVDDYVLADRHLPDGTRQHLVQGHAAPGLIVCNAQVFGAADFPDELALARQP